MNVSMDDFEKTVRAKYPHKYMFDTCDPIDGVNVRFALDTAGESHLDYSNKVSVSSHIWKDGKVIKDNTGIFSISTNSISASSIIKTSFNFPIGSIPFHFVAVDYAFEEAPQCKPLSVKCTCGNHSIGSKRHSSWCDIKGEA